MLTGSPSICSRIFVPVRRSAHADRNDPKQLARVGRSGEEVTHSIIDKSNAVAKVNVKEELKPSLNATSN